MAGVNWFLIIVVAAVALMTVALSLYLIVIYQHPEDKNQAWFPKIVVLLGLCVAIYTVLLFPLDVANQQSCTLDIPLVDCTFTFPMRTIWEGLYIANMLLVFMLIPFSLFYYEADSEWCAPGRAGGAPPRPAQLSRCPRPPPPHPAPARLPRAGPPPSGGPAPSSGLWAS
jgi:LMBR1 domain-containing protein 1